MQQVFVKGGLIRKLWTVDTTAYCDHLPYAYVSNDMLKANYSNSRLALLEFRRRIESYQHAVMVWQLCRQVWARWMDVAVLAGALDVPEYDQRRREYLACAWLPPKWNWVDPLKDARAEIEQIDAGLKSRTQALAERGYDAEQVDAQIAADKARERTLGLTFGAARAGGMPTEPDPPAASDTRLRKRPEVQFRGPVRRSEE